MAEGRHPESYCHRCGGPNIWSWHAPSPLWNYVMRGGLMSGAEDFNGIVCPICFAELAKQRGIDSHWRLIAEDVSVELETVTPSGHVWDEASQFWIDGVPEGSAHE